MQPPRRLSSTPSWLLTQTATQAHRVVGAAFERAGARRYHYALLAALAEFGPASQADLGRRCGIDRSDVVAALAELTARGEAERQRDPSDGRRNLIHLTGPGSTRLLTLDRELADAQDALLAPLSAADRATLADLLGRVLRHHRAARTSRPAPPVEAAEDAGVREPGAEHGAPRG